MNAKKRTPTKRRRYISWIVLFSGFVIGLAAFTGAIEDLYKFAIGVFPKKHIAPFTVMATPKTLPEEIKMFRQQESHRLDAPPTMDQAALDLPAFDTDAEVWLEATCIARCDDDQAFVGVKILYNDKTLVERESPQGPGEKSASAFVILLVRAGNALQFDIDGFDHHAKRKEVIFRAYSSALP